MIFSQLSPNLHLFSPISGVRLPFLFSRLNLFEYALLGSALTGVCCQTTARALNTFHRLQLDFCAHFFFCCEPKPDLLAKTMSESCASICSILRLAKPNLSPQTHLLNSFCSYYDYFSYTITCRLVCRSLIACIVCVGGWDVDVFGRHEVIICTLFCFWSSFQAMWRNLELNRQNH